tara:strand:- start:596 stop:985 length:390 start_codon:yes stop_codon:yes gene_type:complete
MADKVIDFKAAKERMRKKPSDEFSMAREIEWVNSELDRADEELNEITEEMEELTQYIMELSTYMAGITVALGIQESNGVDEWMKILKAQREALGYGEEVEEKAPVQFELELEDEILTVDFIPEFDLDDN